MVVDVTELYQNVKSSPSPQKLFISGAAASGESDA
jgi:hypothetical protein